MDGPEVERDWFIVSRWQEYGAERRANLLRVLAIAAFYLVHMANYYRWFGLPEMPGADRRFHQLMTALAAAWIAVALAIRVALDRQFWRQLPELFAGNLNNFLYPQAHTASLLTPYSILKSLRQLRAVAGSCSGACRDPRLGRRSECQ